MGCAADPAHAHFELLAKLCRACVVRPLPPCAGWFTIAVAGAVALFSHVWHHGMATKHAHEAAAKVRARGPGASSGLLRDLAAGPCRALEPPPQPASWLSILTTSQAGCTDVTVLPCLAEGAGGLHRGAFRGRRPRPGGGAAGAQVHGEARAAHARDQPLLRAPWLLRQAGLEGWVAPAAGMALMAGRSKPAALHCWLMG